MSFSDERKIEKLLSSRNFEESLRLIQSKIEREPHSADAYYLYGVWHYFQGKIGPTIENLKKSLEMDPRHTDAAICLSVLFNDIGRYEEAKQVFEQANQSVVAKQQGSDGEIDRKFAVKHLELADLYFRYRRYHEAIEEYGKASTLDPSNLDTRIRRAKALAKKGFLSRAVQELQQLKVEYPSYTPARLQLGLLHFSQGEILEADVEWEQVLTIDPSNREAKAYMEMARAPQTRL